MCPAAASTAHRPRYPLPSRGQKLPFLARAGWIGLASVVTLALPAVAQNGPAEGPTEVPVPVTDTGEAAPFLVDRLVAWVDEDPIFLSDVRRALDLGLVDSSAVDGGSHEADETGPLTDRQVAERRALDRLIDERLRLHEVERYESTPVPTSAVDQQLGQLEQRAGGEAAFELELASLGIGRDEVRGLLRRQLRILAYVEERLGARIFVDEQTIRDHYRGPLRRELTERGQELPDFGEVREAIRELLFQRQLNREIESWTLELRAEATILDLYDQAVGEPSRWPSRVFRTEIRSEPLGSGEGGGLGNPSGLGPEPPGAP